MRSKGQIQVCQRRADLANELMAWMKESNLLTGYRLYPVMVKFSRYRDVKIFECWKAWEILKAAGRVTGDNRHHWVFNSFVEVSLDENGDVRRDAS